MARRPRPVRPDRGVPLLRRPDRQPRRRARGPDQRLAARRGLRRLRRGRPRGRHHQRHRGVPEITTEVLVAANEEGGETNISTGWHAIEFLLWGQDLSEDGPGARPLTDYTTAADAERRGTYLTLLAAPPHRRPHRRARPVGPRGRRLPRGVPRRSRPGRHQHLPGHGRPVAGRAGRRAHRRRLRHQGPGGRALLLLRQHHRRHRGQRRRHPAWSTLASYTGSTARRCPTSCAEVDPELDAALREQLDANVAAAEALEAPFDQLSSARTTPRARGAARARSRASRPRATPSPSWPAPSATRSAWRSSRRVRRPSASGLTAAALVLLACSDSGRRVTAPAAAAHRPGAGRPGRRRHRRGRSAPAPSPSRSRASTASSGARSRSATTSSTTTGSPPRRRPRAATASARCSTPSRARRATSATAGPSRPPTPTTPSGAC